MCYFLFFWKVWVGNVVVDKVCDGNSNIFINLFKIFYKYLIIFGWIVGMKIVNNVGYFIYCYMFKFESLVGIIIVI